MKIHRALISLILFAVTTTGFAQEPAAASAVLDKVYAQAKKENKKVFLIFHASWCSWCKKMDSHMAQPQLKPLFDKYYVTAHLDVQEAPNKKNLENPGGDEVMRKFKADKAGLPFFVILDAKGNLLEDSFDASGQNLGCPASKEEVAEFIKMLKKTSKLSDKELSLIADTFTLKK